MNDTSTIWVAVIILAPLFVAMINTIAILASLKALHKKIDLMQKER